MNVPDTLCKHSSAGLPFSLADLLLAAGADPTQLHSISVCGGEWQSAAMIAPFLHHPVPLTQTEGRMEIGIAVMEQPFLQPPLNPVPMGSPPLMMTSPGVAGGVLTAGPEFGDDPANDEFQDDLPAFDSSQPVSEGMMFERIESAWKSSIQMERQMAGLRQKLAGILNTLGKLDRDLQPEERLAADREDRDAWQEARRWARDMAAKCHREIKSFDIGMTSAAGKRNWMEQTYQQVIEPRVPGSDLEEIRREFESYRKDIVNLQRSMHAALQGATQNGTQRANRVLGTIKGKIRERRARMREPLGATNMDKSVRRKK